MASFPEVATQLALLERGAVDLVDKAQLTAKLERSRASGKPLTIKTGFDPNRPDLQASANALRH